MTEKKNFSWRLGEYMIQRGWINWDQLQEALTHQEKARRGMVASVSDQRVFSARSRNELSLGEILVRNTWLAWEQLEECLNEQIHTNQRIGEILVAKGYVSEENLFRALAIQYNLAYVDIGKETIKKEVISRVPKEIACEYQMMPLVERAGILLIAVSDPTHEGMDSKLAAAITDVELHAAIARPSDVKKAHTKYYGL